MSTPSTISPLPRAESLDRQSQDHMAHAQRSLSPHAAYQSGYCALIATIAPAELRAFDDHPNVDAAALAAHRLKLSTEDQELARDGAEMYYSPTQRSAFDLHRTVEWARRVRAAAGWAR
jgi:hypothetical protein